MKEYNWKKGGLFIGICAVIGFIVGFSIMKISKNYELHNLITNMDGMMPYLFILSFVIGITGLGGYFYLKTQFRKDNYSNEENSFYEKNEKLMSLTTMCATLSAVLNFTALGINLFNEHSFGFLFIVNVIISFLGEVGHISLIKKIRPELNADPMSTNFNKDYFEKLDEYEKNKAGKASFKTMTAMTPLYIFLFLGCYILTLILNVSPVICLPVGIIWAVQIILYTYHSTKTN